MRKNMGKMKVRYKDISPVVLVSSVFTSAHGSEGFILNDRKMIINSVDAGEVEGGQGDQQLSVPANAKKGP